MGKPVPIGRSGLECRVRQRPAGAARACYPVPMDAEACYRAVQGRDARFAGRFFLAVRTTRIYCRPGCPARLPRRENVEFFPSAAAAEQAGFRACLRCRPDALPGSPAQAGTAATLSRAPRLLEESGEAGGLAPRLGVSDLHLRPPPAPALRPTPGRTARRRLAHPPAGTGAAADRVQRGPDDPGG